MRYFRALGWGAFAAAPILLTALAFISARPHAPPSVVMHSAIAAWIAGTLAAVAALLAQRGARGAFRMAAVLSALVVLLFCGFLVMAAMQLAPRVAQLDERERAELVTRGERLEHPSLGFSIAALESAMRPSPSVARETERAGGPAWARAHRVWAWQGEDTEVIVDLARIERADGGTLERATREIASPLPSREVRRSVDARTLNAELEAPLPGGGHFLARIVLFERAGRAYRLAITVVTRDSTSWRSWLTELRAPGADRAG